jgi:hypothetical protein
MYGSPPPKPKYRYTAPVFMLLAGLAIGSYGGDQLRTYLNNPSRTDVECAPDVITTTGDDKWIALLGCEADFDNALEIFRGKRVESMYVPLLDGSGRSAGLLHTQDEETLDAAAAFRVATSEAAEREAGQRLYDRLRSAALHGVTNAIHVDDDDLLARHLPDVSRDTIVLEHLEAPSRSSALAYLGFGGLLLALSIVVLLRARKLTAADVATTLAWHQQARAHAQAQAQAHAQAHAHAQAQQDGQSSGHGPPPG